jgi:hypothetical protein
VLTSGAPYEHVTIHTRRGEIILAARLCQGIGIQRPVRYLSCKTGQHRRGTPIVSRVTTAGVLSGHGETRASAKSHQGRIYTKAPSARGAEDFM